MIGKIAKTATAIYLVKQGFDFLKDSINKAAAEEKNLRTLQSVIENQGDSWVRVKDKVKDYIQQLEYNSMFTDDQLIPSMKQLINAGMTTEQSMRALSSATDLATAKGIDLETSANLIGKAYMGNTDILKRYGIQAKDFNGVMSEINRKFGGSAQKDMDSYAGSVKRLETSWDAFQKTLGQKVIPEVNRAVLALDTLLGGGTKPQMSSYENKLKFISEQVAYLQEQGAKRSDEEDRRLIRLTAEQDVLMNLVGLEKQRTAKEEKPTPFKPGISDKERTDLYKWLDEQEGIYLKIGAFREQTKIDEYNIIMAIERQIADETNQLGMSSYDYEMQMIQQTADAYKVAGADKVAVDKWASAQKVEALNKEFHLEKNVHKIVDVLAIGSAEQKKYLIADILEAEMLAQSKKFAWMAVEELLDLNFAGAAIAGAAALALGYGASVIHAETELDKSRNREAQEAREAAAETAITETGAITTSYAGGGGAVTSIERAPAATYYNINNSYILQAGLVLGDEFNLNAAFAKLMEKYNQTQLLTASGE